MKPDTLAEYSCRRRRTVGIIALVLVVGVARYANAADPLAFFEARIRPVLVAHCYECHSSQGKAEGKLVLDHRDAFRRGGESGPAVVPGDPSKSLVLKALRYEELEMPPVGKLPPAVVADFTQWIQDGAIDPRDMPPTPADVAQATWKAQLADRRNWWSLQPPRDSSIPEVTDSNWSREPVDRFVRAKLDGAGLTPAPSADATVLVRRLAFVLTGLPPSPEQVVEFRQAYSAAPDEALAKLVDQLLDSPHYGERIARHWMDVVRYTDTYGYEWDNPAKGSWEYRDYLTRAFNGDVGFDQLVREQIAGDLLPQPRTNESEGVNESLIGPMFYHMGEHRHGTSLDFNGIHQEMIDNKIDAFSKAFLGFTVACARCHDHKLDAISQADYYALAGVFMTPRWTPRDISGPQANAEILGELKRLRAEIRRAIEMAWNSPESNLATSGGTLSGAKLREWAHQQRETLATSKIEDTGYPLAQLLDPPGVVRNTPEEIATADRELGERWKKLAGEWSTQRAARQAGNAATFQVLTDFSTPGFPAGWSVDGQGIELGYVDHGEVLVSLQGDGLVQSLLERGYHTHALSSKLAGAIRLPRPETLPKKMVSLKMAGGEWAGWIDVPQNAFQAEGVSFFDPAAPAGWRTVTSRPLSNGVTRVLTEFCTASLNPNFPPRTGLAKSGGTSLPDADLGRDKRSWLSVTGVVAHDAPGAPANSLERFASLFDSAPPATSDEAWDRIARWLGESVQRWSQGKGTAEDVSVLNWLLAKQLLPNSRTTLPNVAELVDRYRQTEARLPFARSTVSMDERGVEPVDYRLNLRGDVHNEGPAIRRGFLEVFAGQHRMPESPASGRLELAEYLASRQSPQTARVYVNRVWQWVFGTGLVATPNDFGKLGELPSHPELLDWLALRFMDEGWSTKRLVRRLVLSRTFRQSGVVQPLATEKDPDNRLLHHYPTRRLEAEAIRDSLLVVAGHLDRRLYGPPINPPRVAEDASKRLYTGPWDTAGRRSLYTTMSIMEPPKFLVVFNLPDLKLPTGRRDQTNVPTQALTLLNDPLVTKLADDWAQQLVRDGRTSADDRITAMFLAALGREPTGSELERWRNAAASFAPTEAERMSSVAAWSAVAHALFNAKEFIYFR